MKALEISVLWNLQSAWNFCCKFSSYGVVNFCNGTAILIKPPNWRAVGWASRTVYVAVLPWLCWLCCCCAWWTQHKKEVTPTQLSSTVCKLDFHTYLASSMKMRSFLYHVTAAIGSESTRAQSSSGAPSTCTYSGVNGSPFIRSMINRPVRKKGPDLLGTRTNRQIFLAT